MVLCPEDVEGSRRESAEPGATVGGSWSLGSVIAMLLSSWRVLESALRAGRVHGKQTLRDTKKTHTAVQCIFFRLTQTSQSYIN